MPKFKFRILDLIVAIVCVWAFTGWIIPTVNHMGDFAGAEKCGSNLREIGHALTLYSNDNHGAYPRTRWNPASTEVNSYTHPDATNPFAPDGPLDNDITASLYLLVRIETHAIYFVAAALAAIYVFWRWRMQRRGHDGRSAVS